MDSRGPFFLPVISLNSRLRKSWLTPCVSPEIELISPSNQFGRQFASATAFSPLIPSNASLPRWYRRDASENVINQLIQNLVVAQLKMSSYGETDV